MILECSSDLIADPADRNYESEQLHMLIETCDEGIVMGLDDELVNSGVWLDVGTTIGRIIEEEDDGSDENDDVGGKGDEFLWQAYLHDEEEK